MEKSNVLLLLMRRFWRCKRVALHSLFAVALAGLPFPALAQVGESEPVLATLPRNLTRWGLVTNSDLIVQAVLIILAVASVVTWTVWLAKTIEIVSARRRVQAGMNRLAGTGLPADGAQGDVEGEVGQFLAAALAELRVSGASLEADGIKERIASRLERLEAAFGRRLSRGTGVLATIGSTAPFVGLFGTVLGIIDSFIGISNSHTSNLAVVAPGIAEALFATALGLAAAIPAVVIYNVFARSIAGYRALLGDAAAEVLRLVSRHLDRQLQVRPTPVRRAASAAAE
jgi:biopolymer transport protein ExbB